MCRTHGGGIQCQVPGCTKLAQGKTMKCSTAMDTFVKRPAARSIHKAKQKCAERTVEARVVQPRIAPNTRSVKPKSV
jgi:hypothetical protein